MVQNAFKGSMLNPGTIGG